MGCVCIPETLHGYDYWPWIAQHLHQCVYTPLQVMSVVVGMLSVLCWACSQIPQLYTTYKVKSVDSISSLFLVQWLIGDLANLVGCILTNQLPTQIWIASYFSAIDIIWISQYFYYSIWGKGLDMNLFFFAWVYLIIWIFIQCGIITPSPGSSSLTSDGLELCQPKMEISSELHSIGRFMGWFAALSYFVSRMPQIWHLYNTKNPEGLSQMMFLWAALGNMTNGISIILWDIRKDALYESLPWLIGSIGTVQFDIAVLVQIMYYSKQLNIENFDLSWIRERVYALRRKVIGKASSSSSGSDSDSGDEIWSDMESERIDRHDTKGPSLLQICSTYMESCYLASYQQTLHVYYMVIEKLSRKKDQDE